MFLRKITGMGLLLLRLSVTLTLLPATHKNSGVTPCSALWWAALALVLLLGLGLFTRLSALLVGLLLLRVADMPAADDLLQAAALALLGPGACSLDARWFGQQLVFVAGPPPR